MCDYIGEMELHIFGIRPACQRGVILFPHSQKYSYGNCIIFETNNSISLLGFLIPHFFRILDYTTLAKTLHALLQIILVSLKDIASFAKSFEIVLSVWSWMLLIRSRGVCKISNSCFLNCSRQYSILHFDNFPSCNFVSKC